MLCEFLGCTEPAHRWCVWFVRNKRGVKRCAVVLCAGCYPVVRAAADSED